MNENGGNEVTVADVLNTFHHLLYQHVTDDRALDQMYVILEGIEQHMIAVDEALTAVTEQRNQLAAENEGLVGEREQILQSLDEWQEPSHPKVSEMIEAVEESIWEEAEPELIAYAHENLRDEMIEALAGAIMDKYPVRAAFRVAQKMTDLLLDLPDTEYSQGVADVLKMLAEEVDRKGDNVDE